MSTIAAQTPLLRDVLRIPHIHNELKRNEHASSNNSAESAGEKVHYFFERDDYNSTNSLVKDESNQEKVEDEFCLKTEIEKLLAEIELADEEEEFSTECECTGTSGRESDEVVSLEEESFCTLNASLIINRQRKLKNLPPLEPMSSAYPIQTNIANDETDEETDFSNISNQKSECSSEQTSGI